MKILSILPLMGTVLAANLLISDSAKKATLRLELETNRTVEMHNTMKMNYFKDAKLTDKMMSTDIVIENHYTVDEVLSDGIYDIDYVIDRIKLNQSMGGMNMEYDSQADNSENPMAAQIAAQFDPILGKDISLKVNKMGETVEEASLPDGASSMGNLANMSDNLFIKFPEEEISVGQSWTDSKSTSAGANTVSMDLVYTVKEISKDEVILAMKVDPSSVTMEGEDATDLQVDQKGTMTFLRKSGILKNADMSSMIEVNSPQMGKIYLVNNMTTKLVNN